MPLRDEVGNELDEAKRNIPVQTWNWRIRYEKAGKESEVLIRAESHKEATETLREQHGQFCRVKQVEKLEDSRELEN